jgi:hypothetical protein
MILVKKYLEIKIRKYNLIPLEVSSLNLTNKIFLDINEINEFLELAIDSKCYSIFYHYNYYNPEEYIIPLEWYSEYSNDFKNEVFRYNTHIKSLDFACPNRLTLFILQHGTLVGIELQNCWLENDGIKEAEEYIELLEEKFYREVEKINTDREKQHKHDENELREIIFNDSEFSYCKNQHLRYYYLIDLLEKEDMQKYKYLLHPFGAPHIGKVKMFMDKTWMLYKEYKKS